MQEVVFFIAPLFQLDLQCIECSCVVGDHRPVEIDIICIDPAVKIEIDNPSYEEGSCGRDIPDYGLFVPDIDGFSTLVKVSNEGVEVIGIQSAGNLGIDGMGVISENEYAVLVRISISLSEGYRAAAS